MLQKFTLEYYFEKVSSEEAEEFFNGLIDAIIGYTEAKGKTCGGVSKHEPEEVEDEQETDVLKVQER
jgi:hypothetical protein